MKNRRLLLLKGEFFLSRLICISESFFITVAAVLCEQIQWTKVIFKPLDMAIASFCVCSVKHCRTLLHLLFPAVKVSSTLLLSVGGFCTSE